ncbi:hypothetical protein [Streptomyces anthocyanicus]|uniref:hypothetical protein n=1 Tax=Streptomyces anthocyanicus TaxID=68174 RepID=UPI003662B5DE
MRYSPRGPLRGPALLAAAVALTTVAACSNGSPSGAGSPPPPGTAPAATTSAAKPTAAPTPSPTPTRTYPLSRTPRTVPAVRSHEPARGPGWKPAASAGVVLGADSAGLADEGRLLAQELGLRYRGEAAAGPGDVELALGGKGAAESYALTLYDGRVRNTRPHEARGF